jgi:hypothetical protein
MIFADAQRGFTRLLGCSGERKKKDGNREKKEAFHGERLADCLSLRNPYNNHQSRQKCRRKRNLILIL